MKYSIIKCRICEKNITRDIYQVRIAKAKGQTKFYCDPICAGIAKIKNHQRRKVVRRSERRETEQRLRESDRLRTKRERRNFWTQKKILAQCSNCNHAMWKSGEPTCQRPTCRDVFKFVSLKQ